MRKELLNQREAQALAFARAEVEDFSKRVPFPLDGKAAWFDKDQSRSRFRELFKGLAERDAAGLVRVVTAARAGDTIAQEALKILLDEYLNRGQVPPVYLGAYQIDLNNGRVPKRRGQHSLDRYFRDIAITVIVQRVADHFGLKPTGRSPRWRSACAIVGDALVVVNARMSEKAVAEIWRKYGAI